METPGSVRGGGKGINDAENHGWCTSNSDGPVATLHCQTLVDLAVVLTVVS
jgi:hypothetical protein